jgi:hypothetical protein
MTLLTKKSTATVTSAVHMSEDEISPVAVNDALAFVRRRLDAMIFENALDGVG